MSPMSQELTLLAEIRAAADARGLSPATITSRAVGNSRLVRTLEQGGSCSLKTAARIRDWLRDTETPAAGVPAAVGTAAEGNDREAAA